MTATEVVVLSWGALAFTFLLLTDSPSKARLYGAVLVVAMVGLVVLAVAS